VDISKENAQESLNIPKSAYNINITWIIYQRFLYLTYIFSICDKVNLLSLRVKGRMVENLILSLQWVNVEQRRKYKFLQIGSLINLKAAHVSHP